MAGSYRFEIKKNTLGEYYFNFVSANNEVMFTSEGVINKADIESSIETIKEKAALAIVIDKTGTDGHSTNNN